MTCADCRNLDITDVSEWSGSPHPMYKCKVLGMYAGKAHPICPDFKPTGQIKIFKDDDENL